MLQGFTPQLRLETRHRIRICPKNMHLWFLYIACYMMLFTRSNVNQNSRMASMILVQIHLEAHDNMEMNWGLERRAARLKLATCNFPNPADLRVITVFQWCTNALRAMPNWQVTFWSYFITALIVMQIKCKLSGSLRWCHFLQWIPQTCRKNFFYIFFLHFSICRNKFALILVTAEYCRFFIGSFLKNLMLLFFWLLFIIFISLFTFQILNLLK